MKILPALLICLLFLISCKKTEEEPLISETTEKPDPVTDPKYFVGDHKAQAAVLGVFHFNDPGLDSYKQEFSVNILSEGKQAELDSLLDKLEQYQPTKILLEISRKEKDSALNAAYQKYLNNEFSIKDKSNEIFQIGFRLAQRLGHDRIYASDVKNANWFGADIDWDTYDSEAYKKSLGQYEKASRYDFGTYYRFKDSLKQQRTLTQYLSLLNTPDIALKSHQAYLTGSILTGAGDLYIGADIVARWYQRNLKIFANTYDLADFSQKERILLIYGSGHVWQLRQLLTDSPDFDYVEINDYLAP